MPATLNFPGVYIEEIPSGVRTITGVATSITAFIGRTLRGPVDDPVVINSNADFQRIFGGLWLQSPLGYAVSDFFLNGGSQAIIVRLFAEETGQNPVAGLAQLNVGGLTLQAATKGKWGRSLRATVNKKFPKGVAEELGIPEADLFNLIVKEVDSDEVPIRTETFSNLSVKDNSRRIDRVLKEESELVRWRGGVPDPTLNVTEEDDAVSKEAVKLPDAKKKVVDAQKELNALKNKIPPATLAEIQAAEAKLAQAKQDLTAAEKAVSDAQKAIIGGSDGSKLTELNFTGPNTEKNKEGLFALEKADLFNLLCIPPYEQGGDIDDTLIGAAATYCEKKRAMLIVDPPRAWNTVAKAIAGLPNIGTVSKNAALFFPRIRQQNLLRDNKLEEFVPCGVVAGVFARTDAQRGVWKAPAGLDATLVNVPQLTVPLTNPENGQLNPLAVNCLRELPAAGRVVWGSRTLQGSDRLGSEWKYVPVRRTALFIEESLYRALHWVVFEPNDEPLWAQIRLNVGAFMNSLFRQGAFQGQSPREAYFVKCDKDTTTQNDIDRGIVNILVGFAPLKPAEFVVVKLQQIAGQIQT